MNDTPIVLGESWTSTRFSIRSPRSFEDLSRLFENVVPAYPTQEYAERIEAKATWEEILAFTATVSELGLLTYWKDSVTPIMRVAGNQAKCTVYFIGNFPVAERMYRTDPRVMHYAPLRVTITENDQGEVHLTIDQPSAGFASLGEPAITAVGNNVDQKFAQLLSALELPVPAALHPTTSPEGRTA